MIDKDVLLSMKMEELEKFVRFGEAKKIFNAIEQHQVNPIIIDATLVTDASSEQGDFNNIVLLPSTSDVNMDVSEAGPNNVKSSIIKKRAVKGTVQAANLQKFKFVYLPDLKIIFADDILLPKPKINQTVRQTLEYLIKKRYIYDNRLIRGEINGICGYLIGKYKCLCESNHSGYVSKCTI